MFVYIFAATVMIQIILMGILWQLSPIYVISALHLILKLSGKMPVSKTLMIVLYVVTLLLVLISIGLLVMVPIFKLPETNSNVTVGVKYVELTDASRGDRIIKLKVWYPAEDRSGELDTYHSNAMKDLNGLMGMPGLFFSHFDKIKTGAYINAPLSKSKTLYPLVIYSHGASSTYIDNTYLMKKLAMKGYVAIAVDHEFDMKAYGLDEEKAKSMNVENQLSFVDDLMDKVVPNQSNDIVFLRNYIENSKESFYEAIDYNKISMIGHSLGGTTVSLASSQMNDIKAVINMDGPMIDNLKDFNSFLYMSSFDPNLSNDFLASKKVPVEFYRSIKVKELVSVESFFEKDNPLFKWARVNEAGHLDFTDLGFMTRLMKTPNYDYLKGLNEIHDVVIDFLDVSLRGEVYEPIDQDSIVWLK